MPTNGYIDPAAKVIRHWDRVLDWDRGKKRAPVTIEWDLSNKCTLGCVDCHFAYTHTAGPWTTMARTFPHNRDRGGVLADSMLVARVLRECKQADVQGIVWTGGGEPTTHPEWFHIIEDCSFVGLEQGMYTHGGLLKAETAAILGSKATWVVVSLDCIKGDSYASEKKVPTHRFDAACEGIVHLVGRSAVIGVSYLLHAGNWTLARDMVEFTRKLGAHYTTLRPAVHTAPDAPGEVRYDRSWITHALPLLQELSEQPDVEVNPERFLQYRDWTTHGYTCCEGIKLNTTITPDGRMWVCPNRREYSNSCLGDLTKESFGEIWARHPGQWTDFKECRAMCRLHAVNHQIAEIRRPVQHGAFI